MLSALIASVGSAGGDIVAKIILDFRKFPVRKYLAFLFVCLAVITLIFVPSSFYFDAGKFFSFKFVLLFLSMLFTALFWNFRFYTSIQKESLHELELVILFTPITTIILAALFYPDERNFGYFIAALIASGALVLGRLKKSHIEITANIKRSFLAMFFMAVEAVIIKELLLVFSPAFLYFCRTFFMALVFIYYFKPKREDYTMDKTATRLIVLDAVFGVLFMVLKFFSYGEFGIVKTTLVLLIAPVLTYLASYFYFKEHRLFRRDLGSALVILLCLIFIILKG